MLDVAAVRAQFPALASGTAFFDNPGGTQVPRRVPEAMARYLLESNANHGGAFETSRRSDAALAEARGAFAAFLGAASSDEIVFGPNMTTLTFHVARSLARTLQPGDEVVVTRLDHDANVAPWLGIAQERGARVRWVDVSVPGCAWSPADLAAVLSSRTRIVAVGLASNAVGTVNPVREAARLAREAGALTYVDAVHWAPHGPTDVAELGCDFLACSAYKFFGPHLGILWGKAEHLERLTAEKVRPSPSEPPDKWETGTPSFEAIAGARAALDYLAWIGATFGEPAARGAGGLRGDLAAGMAAIRAHEKGLSRALLEGLTAIKGLDLRGSSDPAGLDGRVPTFAFTLEGISPRDVCERLDREGVAAWDGNYYALALMERLGLEGKGGMVRVGAVHYNDLADVERLLSALRSFAR